MLLLTLIIYLIFPYFVAIILIAVHYILKYTKLKHIFLQKTPLIFIKNLVIIILI